MIPDDGSGTALAGDLDLPLDILGGTPLDGRIAVGNGSIGIGPTPRGPLVGGWVGRLQAWSWAEQDQARDNERKNSHGCRARGYRTTDKGTVFFGVGEGNRTLSHHINQQTIV